ncbi:hypothetical protein FACS1894201_02200 [Bacteroidia bacterium]|nr:hypothetical protein FACS1894201_02200 [Bacteroidia bacterium]
MQLTVNIGYDQIVNLVKQLPANQIEKIKQEFTQEYIKAKARAEISEFQEFLLSGPVMSEQQYKEFNENREHLNAWRIQ